MKKLFTLIVLMACFLGAKAVEITDFTVDYTKVGKSTVGWKADLIQDDWITGDDDGLHLNNPAATENFWDYQLWIFNGAELEVDMDYTVKIVAKVSDGSATVRCRIGDWGGGIAGDIVVNSTEYQEYILTGAATVASSGLLVQFGDYVGTVSFKSVTIVHEGKEAKPVQWANMIENGDAEGEYGEVACAYSKEWGENLGEDGAPTPHPAPIVDLGGNKVFLSHHNAVNPPLLWDSDGEQWGQQHSAGDPMPDNAWQNQFWINLPRPIKEGTQLKVTFKYKASKACKADLQTHTTPGNYLGGFTPGSIDFGTDWTDFEKEFTAPGVDSNGNPFQSIAFNLGVGEQYKEDIDFYFDDITVSTMVLDEGYFVASTNTVSGLVDYDFDNAIEFTTEDDVVYTATVGTVGKQDTWVNQVMISTVRGNDKAFRGATLKATEAVVNDPDTWQSYTAGSNAKIDLRAAGVWKITINTEFEMMSFEKLEGEADVEFVDIATNTSEFVIKATERDFKSDEQEGGTGQPWDNQFWIAANRVLDAGEVTIVEFDYVANKEAKATTQVHKEGDDGKPCTYLDWHGIGDVNFTTEEQHFSNEFTIDAAAAGMKSIVFNLSEIKDACDYTIKNVKWYLKDISNADGKTPENLIKATGTENFWVKIDKSAPYLYGDESGISSVVKSNMVNAASYNLAGQRVSGDYKGIVVKNGKKYVVK